MFINRYQNKTDEELMGLLAKGKEQAFRVIYQRYWERMNLFFKRALNDNPTIAADFAQELFIKIIEKPEAFDIQRKFSTWLFTVANNMVKNEYRRLSRRPAVESIDNESFTFEGEAPFEVLEQQLQSKNLNEAVKTLKPKHKICFVFRYYEGLSIKEIGEITEVAEGTVKSRLFYAVAELTEKLNKRKDCGVNLKTR